MKEEQHINLNQAVSGWTDSTNIKRYECELISALDHSDFSKMIQQDPFISDLIIEDIISSNRNRIQRTYWSLAKKIHAKAKDMFKVVSQLKKNIGTSKQLYKNIKTDLSEREFSFTIKLLQELFPKNIIIRSRSKNRKKYVIYSVPKPEDLFRELFKRELERRIN